MAISVPSEPKIYTTVYDNFKGVDFTNDLTNVYRRRSPTGVNMLPDLDGRPFKRPGWEAEVTHNEFIDAANHALTYDDTVDPSFRFPYTLEIKPLRTYYFTFSGMDYILIFNTLGAFLYSDDGLSCQGVFEKALMRGDPEYYGYIDYGLPPNVDIDRAFFFEGKGNAGFYVFAKTDLYRYGYVEWSNGDPFTKLDENEKHIPRVLTLCDPSGVGVADEEINLISRYRTVGYACDGTTASFKVPGGYVIDPTSPLPFPKNASIKVEVRNASTGDWETVPSSDFAATQPAGMISFKSSKIPQVIVNGEDNMRITYSPDGIGSETIITEGVETEPYKFVAVIEDEYIDVLPTKYVGRIMYGELNSKSLSGLVPGTAVPYIKVNGTFVNASNYIYIYDAAYNSRVLTLAPKGDILNLTPDHEETVLEYDVDDLGRRIVRMKQKKTFTVKLVYSTSTYVEGSEGMSEAADAFSSCSRVLIHGNGIINNVFMTGSTAPKYATRVWWSAATDPTYFPDLNYIEVGANDTDIMGLMKVGEYLGVIKKGSGTNTSIYLAYPTSFSDDTTYAVKQSINGIGAVAYGAFNSLEDEPLFLSPEGVMAIETRDGERQLRNRSYFVNNRLISESGLPSAVSFVYDGMYWLAINNHVYVLDGSQKNSWANTKTNLQYEAYYLDNVPAHCFAKKDDNLYFTDFVGNLCRFKKDTYHDEYSVLPDWVSSAQPTTHGVMNDYIPVTALTAQKEQTAPAVGENILYDSNGVKKGYTIYEVNDTYVRVKDGVPVTAVWSTIADDDGAVHFFKNLKKKGSMVSLLPSSDSGVEIYLKPDRKDPIFVCESDAKQTDIPFDVYMKKKVKKYKRLQIICKNSTLDDAFGVDQIIKCYTMGNYSKNRG